MAGANLAHWVRRTSWWSCFSLTLPHKSLCSPKTTPTTPTTLKMPDVDDENNIRPNGHFPFEGPNILLPCCSTLRGCCHVFIPTTIEFVRITRFRIATQPCALRRAKEHTYPDLLQSPGGRLVLPVVDPTEASQFVPLLARSRAHAVTQLLLASAVAACARRPVLLRPRRRQQPARTTRTLRHCQRTWLGRTPKTTRGGIGVPSPASAQSKVIEAGGRLSHSCFTCS